MPQQAREILDSFEPIADVILPSQFSDLMGKHGLSSEQRLMLAVLVDAINILRGWRSLGNGHKRRWFAEAGRWVFARGRSYAFSFDNVCDALGIDAEVLRRRLSAFAIGASSTASTRPARLRLKEASRAQHMTVNRIRRRGHRHPSPGRPPLTAQTPM